MGFSVKASLVRSIQISPQVALLIRLGNLIGNRLPVIGMPLSILIDRVILLFFALDVSSRNIFVADLRIPHPSGVLLGGNGIRSGGRVLVNAGVKFVGRAPRDEDYLKRHAERAVFRLGDRVMIGANSVLIGPVNICDDVVIGAMSVVTRDIVEPGVYIGSPARKIRESTAADWF